MATRKVKTSDDDVRREMAQLSKQLHEHSYRYYVLDEPTISDAEYDRMFKRLVELEEQHADLRSKDSPTQRVGGAPRDGFAQVQHCYPMVSLANIFDHSELEDFDKKIKRQLGMPFDSTVTYAVEPKIDGLGIELVYVDGVLEVASTRGDGTVGEDVTANAKTIGSVPLRLRKSVSGTVEVRGEVYFPKAEFAELNRELEEEGKKTFANPRNAAAGTLRQLNPEVTAARPMRALFYSLSSIPNESGLPKTHIDLMQWLSELGFPSLKAEKCDGVEAVRRVYDRFVLTRDSFPFEMDGLVVKVNEHRLQIELGSISRAPRWAVAYKLPARQETTLVEDILVQVGRTGAVTPVAVLRPVKIGGVVVSRATLHNAEELSRKDVRIGDTVLVQRAGDVIPEVVHVVTENRPKTARSFVFPKKCPECSAPLERPEDEAVWRCPNSRCPAQIQERIRHFASRGAMDIDGLGDKQIQKFMSVGLVRDVDDIYRLNTSMIKGVEGFADKSADNLCQAIERSKNCELSRFIFALGIRHVGEHVAKLLAKAFPSLDDLLQVKHDQLSALHGVGPEVAKAVVDYVEDSENRGRIKNLRRLGVEPQSTAPKAISTKLSGKTFVVTGTLATLSREQAHALISAHGGHASSSVSKKTDYLVAGEAAGSKLQKAQELGVLVLGEQEFLELVGPDGL